MIQQVIVADMDTMTIVPSPLDVSSSSRETHGTIHNLPSELLGDIFCYACPSLRFPFQFENPTQKHQVAVSSTCSYWRDVSHRTPRLWTSVLVRRSSCDRDDMFDDMLQNVLLRSGILDLDLAIVYPNRGQSKFTDKCASLVSSIIPRTASLRVKWNGKKYNAQPLHIFPITNAPKLRVLHVSGRTKGRRTVELFGSAWSISTPGLMPNLEELAVWNIIRGSRAIKSIPLAQLKSLTAWCIEEDVAQSFLDQCEQLEHLRIARVSSSEGRISRWPASLRTLELETPYEPPSIASLPPTLHHLSIVAGGRAMWGAEFSPPYLSSLDGIRSLSITPWGSRASYSITYYGKLNSVISRAINLEALEVTVNISKAILRKLVKIYLPISHPSSESPFTTSSHSPLSEATEGQPITLREPLSLIRIYHLPYDIPAKAGIESWKSILQPLLWGSPAVAKRIEWWVATEQDAELVYIQLGTVLGRGCIRVMRIDSENPGKGLRPWPKLCNMFSQSAQL